MRNCPLAALLRLLLVVLVLTVLAAPALAAGNDGNVEWDGTGHKPGWQLCDATTRLYRTPLIPGANQSVDLRATSYPIDLTGVTVWYTTNPAAAAQTDWISLPAAYEGPDVVCSRGTVAPWKATVPASSTTVWYKIEYVDGGDSDWQRVSAEGAAGITDDDGGWTTASTALSYTPPTAVYVDDDFTAATPGWGVDHFASIQAGVTAAATGSTVSVAAGTYHESQVILDRAMTVQGAGAAVTVLDGGKATGLPAAGLVCITAAGDVTFDGFTVQNAGDAGANHVRVGVFAASSVAGVTYTVSHNTITGSQNPADNEDYGLMTQGGLESLVFQHNTITGVAGNAILIEKHPGATDVSYNTLDFGVTGDTADVYFSMNYGGADVTTLQRVSHNTIDMGLGTIFDNAHRGTAISFAGNFTQAAAAGGYTNVEITDNTITHLKPYRRGIGLWNNAAGDGATGDIQNAVISGNTLSGPGGAGSAGIRLLGRATGAVIRDNTVSGVEHVFRGMTWNGHVASAALVEHNNFSAGGFEWQGSALLDAEENFWGAGCGPGSSVTVSGNVDFTPWWAQAGGPALVSTGASGDLVIPAGATQAEAAAVFACAAANSVVTFAGGSYPGGYTITTDGLTVKLNAATVGPGSPAFTVDADDVTLTGPGVLDGGGAGDPGVLVLAGADNFTLKDAEVTGWQDGVRLAGSVTSFKMAGNFIHNNSDDGLSLEAGVVVDGIVNVEGNLFKDNTGAGVDNGGATTGFKAQYNSWGDITGPAGPLGDGVAGSVDATNFTFVEPFMDMLPDTLAAAVGVIENASFDVRLKLAAAQVYGFTFKLTYDPAYLALNSTTFAATWTDRCTSLSATAGVIAYRCQLFYPAAPVSVSAGTVATFNFTAIGGSGDGPWTTHLDLSHLVTDTSAAAVGGAKIFVNNAGYGAASAAGRAITDAQDGAVTITGLGQYRGFVDLQGRLNEAGAQVRAYDQETVIGSTQRAGATSAAGGAYTTLYLAGQQMTVGATYWLAVDRPLFLPTTAKAATGWAHSAALTTRPLTPLAAVVLLGGDATDDDLVDMLDATCIGGKYGGGPAACGTGSGSGSNADVNEDGTVDILDLSLMGGNYDKTYSPWTPLSR